MRVNHLEQRVQGEGFRLNVSDQNSLVTWVILTHCDR